MTESNRPAGEIIIYQTEDGETKLEVRLEDETVWLTQQQLAELLQTTKQNISLHIQNIYEEGELTPESTVKKILTVRSEGTRQVKRALDHYDLDMIISVGYRVKSHVATRFRQWATRHLREYIIKGFVLDDERLKQAGPGNYFDELLARIRDIRSSEKIFWRKALCPVLKMSVMQTYSSGIPSMGSACRSMSGCLRCLNAREGWVSGCSASSVMRHRRAKCRPGTRLCCVMRWLMPAAGLKAWNGLIW